MTLNHSITYACMSLADTREHNGRRSNDVIEQWIRAVKPGFKGTDATAWCSAFVFAVCQMAGADLSSSRPNLLARSWLEVGTPKSKASALPGDVVIFRREEPAPEWQGHVGFFCRSSGHDIIVFGGNQDNTVGIKRYPASQVIGVNRMVETIACPTCEGTGVKRQ